MAYLYSLHDKTITTFSVHTSKKYKNLHCKIILAVGTLGEKLTLICITCSCTQIYTFFKSRYAIFKKKQLLRLMYVCFAHLTLNKYAAHHDWYQFTAFEDNLGGIIQISNRSIGKTHGCNSEKSQECICFQRNSAKILKRFEILNMFNINGNAKVMKKKSTLIERSIHEL